MLLQNTWKKTILGKKGLFWLTAPATGLPTGDIMVTTAGGVCSHGTHSQQAETEGLCSSHFLFKMSKDLLLAIGMYVHLCEYMHICVGAQGGHTASYPRSASCRL